MEKTYKSNKPKRKIIDDTPDDGLPTMMPLPPFTPKSLPEIGDIIWVVFSRTEKAVSCLIREIDLQRGVIPLNIINDRRNFKKDIRIGDVQQTGNRLWRVAI